MDLSVSSVKYSNNSIRNNNNQNFGIKISLRKPSSGRGFVNMRDKDITLDRFSVAFSEAAKKRKFDEKSFDSKGYVLEVVPMFDVGTKMMGFLRDARNNVVMHKKNPIMLYLNDGTATEAAKGFVRKLSAAKLDVTP